MTTLCDLATRLPIVIGLPFAAVRTRFKKGN